jgi:hypothetical protein
MVWQGTKCYIFVREFTMTDMVLCPSNHGNPVMNFIEILIHGFKGD